MPFPENPSPVRKLTRLVAALGALAGCVGGSMIWATRLEPAGLGAGGGVLVAVAVGAAMGWFGTECLVALAPSLGAVSE